MRPTPLPPVEEIWEKFSYNPLTGQLYWRTASKRQTRLIGTRAGAVAPRGYVSVGVDGTSHYAHRLIWAFVTGEDPGELDIDHRDGNPTNNAWCNLRAATRSQNLHNMKAKVPGRLKGCYYDPRRDRWVAQLRLNGKTVTVGRYSSAEEAHQAYRQAADQHYGEFARFS